MDLIGSEDDVFNLFGDPNTTGSPERRLLLAVLERAILDFLGNDSDEIDEAEHWLFTEQNDSPQKAFSFAWVCSELDLDLNGVLDKIRKMPRRGESRIPPWYLRDRNLRDQKQAEFLKASHSEDEEFLERHAS